MTDVTKVLSPEDRNAIKELIAKICRGEKVNSIVEWISTFPDKTQVLLVETVNEANKALDEFIAKNHPELLPFIKKIIQEKPE